MLWEDRRLRDITERDLRQVIDSGLAEHLQLEYKSELYSNSDRGNKESLLDICMFANTEGGVLLIGIPELRDPQGQPTGMPDPDARIGLELQNPEATLQALDARVTAAIEERVGLESAAIPVENGAHVLALRIENSTSKPHCVRYQGHVYFPSRRERSRYEMDVREIKELVMRTASQQEKSELLIREALARADGDMRFAYLHISTMPVFYKEFLINLNHPNTRAALAAFDALNERPQAGEITYSFAGLERRSERFDCRVQLQRTGQIMFKRQLPIRDEEPHASFYPAALDLQLRYFVLRARELFDMCEINGPYLLSMMVKTPFRLAGRYAGAVPGTDDITRGIAAGDYAFPTMLLDNFIDVDSLIRPFCDHAHQTFGRSSSPCFDHNGRWIGTG